MATPRPNHESAAAGVSNADRRVANELISLLRERQACDGFELRGTDGRTATLSPPMLSLIERAAKLVADGATVDVLARDRELTSLEAAALLGVSRQYLVRVLDRGEIPFTRIGSHRRVRGADIIAYREQRDAGRRYALARRAQEAQAAGAYEGNVALGPGRTG